jgi:hypothetical protein
LAKEDLQNGIDELDIQIQILESMLNGVNAEDAKGEAIARNNRLYAEQLAL